MKITKEWLEDQGFTTGTFPGCFYKNLGRRNGMVVEILPDRIVAEIHINLSKCSAMIGVENQADILRVFEVFTKEIYSGK